LNKTNAFAVALVNTAHACPANFILDGSTSGGVRWIHGGRITPQVVLTASNALRQIVIAALVIIVIVIFALLVVIIIVLVLLVIVVILAIFVLFYNSS